MVSPAAWVAGPLAEFKVFFTFAPWDSLVCPKGSACPESALPYWSRSTGGGMHLCSVVLLIRVDEGGQKLDPCGVRRRLAVADVRGLSGGRQPVRQYGGEKKSGGRQPSRSLRREDLEEVA
jgi:hypothetical protein